MVDAPDEMWVRGGRKRWAMCVRHWPAPSGIPVDARREPAILLHGLAVSGNYMVPLARVLARDREVFVPDMPGHGSSDKPPDCLDIPAWASILREIQPQLLTGRALLVANSMGGQAAVEYARRHPSMLTAAVLVGSTLDETARPIVQHIGRLARDQFVEPPSLVPMQVLDYLRTGPVRVIEEYRALQRHDMPRALREAAVPVMVVRGGRDPISVASWNRLMARLLPDARLETVPGAGHAVNYNAPERLATLIEQWRGGWPERQPATTEAIRGRG